MIGLLKEAMRQHQEGLLEEAEILYRQVLEKAPENVDALHYLGVLLHQQGDSQTAAKFIRKAVNRNPGYVDAHKNLGNVLQESGKLESAERCYRKAIELQPGDADAHTNLSVLLRLMKRYEESVEASLVSVNSDNQSPIAWLNFGKALKAHGMIDPAIEAFYRALELNSQLVEAHNELCHTLYRAEKIADVPEATIEERISAYQNWLKNEPDNPVINFMLAACAGETTFSRAPDSVVKNLFDGFASSFDHNLAALNYSVPRLIGNRVKETYPKPNAELVVMDAGCGTGLCGEFLKPVASRLVGVDLSAGMLDQARRRSLYDELLEAELTTTLQQDSNRFDLIICADTLCYFGELEEVFAAVAGALKPGARFIFSVELLFGNNSEKFTINTSGRYSHSRKYIHDNLGIAGLNLARLEEAVIRTESGEPVTGLIVEADRTN